MRCIVFFAAVITFSLSYADSESPIQKNATVNQSSTKEEAYVDKLINEGKTSPQFVYSNGFDESYDTKGTPYYFHIDLSEAYNTTNSGYNYREDGLSLGNQFDTIQYGSFSLDGSARSGTSQRPYLEKRTTFYGVLAQRKLPFDSGWYANNFVGTIYTPSIDLVRRGSRFLLPTFAIMGASTEFINTDKAQFQFSAGKPGLINGLLLNEFNPIGGTTITSGAQYSPLPNWKFGIQTIVNRNTPIYGPNSYDSAYFNQYLLTPYNTDTNFIRSNNQAIYTSAAWENDEQYIQANFIQNHTQSMNKQYGVWLDSQAAYGAISSTQGLFYFEPGISWGYSTITNDVQGGYYYANYSSRQWQFNSGTELIQYVSQPTQGIYVTGGLRYQASSKFGLGGNTSYRTMNNKDGNYSASDGYGASLFFDVKNSFGSETTQLDTRFDDQAYFHRLTLNQNWDTLFGTSFNTYVATGVAYTHNRPALNWNTLHSNYYGAGVNIAGSVFQNVTISGGITFDHFNQEYFGQNISANTSINAQLTKHWSLISTYVKTYNNQTDPFVVQPLILLPGNGLYFTIDTFLLTLRYQDSSGTPNAPLGGHFGEASGTVSGYLSIDKNTYHSIPVLQNITIVIDGKFSTQTDAVGFFEFPYVAAGKHSLVVIKDNMPLPWTTSGPENIIIEVSTRKKTKVIVPLINLNDSGKVEPLN